MDPRRVVDKFLDEPRGSAGAAPFAAAGVADVRDVTLDHLLIFVVDRHGPHFFTRCFGALEKFVEIFSRSAEGTYMNIGERDFDCAGERGGVNQVRAAKLAGVE